MQGMLQIATMAPKALSQQGRGRDGERRRRRRMGERMRASAPHSRALEDCRDIRAQTCDRNEGQGHHRPGGATVHHAAVRVRGGHICRCSHLPLSLSRRTASACWGRRPTRVVGGRRSQATGNEWRGGTVCQLLHSVPGCPLGTPHSGGHFVFVQG